MSYRAPATTPLSVWLRDIWDRGRRGRSLARTAAGLGALSPLLALANPIGGQVVGGQASISNPGANATLVKQASQNAAINWQQFSVGANQYVQFLQPDSSAVVLNRVIGGNPSSILGNISANGQVFLINPNGILFGRGAVLDVSGLVASTQDISTADFMAGRYNFIKAAGAPDASVINQGTLSANGGYVVLAGDYVENDGVINAQSGRVLLAAGGATTLTLDRSNGLIGYSIDAATLARLAGVKNTGEISADGGTVIMTADVANALTAMAVNNSGFIAAHSITSRGGVIVLTAQGGDIDNSGTLDASATDAGVAGGTVILRGNGHTQLEPTSMIDASGDGAKGGLVELSGHTLHVDGRVNPGHSGTLLIDPTIIIIQDNLSAPVVSTTTTIGAGYIATQLAIGVKVDLVAGNSIAHTGGAFTLAASNAAGDLSMRIGTLTVGAGGTLSGASCVNAGVCRPGTGTTFTQGFGTINLSGLTINIKGAFTANASQGPVTLGPVNAKAIAITGGTITIGGNLTASAGNLSITAKHGPGTAATITATGAALTGKAVSISASGSYGGIISAGAITATGGSMGIHAIGKVGTFAGNNKFKVKVGNLSATGAVGAVSVGANGLSGSVSVGNINAQGVTVNAAASAKNAKVTTGKIVSTGGVFNVNVGETGPSGSLNVGSISAAGAGVIVTAGNAGGGNITLGNVITSKYLKVSTNAGGIINFNNITATGVLGGTTSLAPVAVYINDAAVPGLVHAASSSKITTTTGTVKILGGTIALGSVSAGGALNVNAHRNGPPTGASISGKTLKALSVNLTASASYGGKITTGGISATGGSMFINAHATNASHAAQVQTGNLNAALRVSVQQSGGGSGGFINVGTITAGGSVSVRASDAAGTGDNVTAGAITGRTIQISAHAKKGGDINVAGGLNATASRGRVSLGASDTSIAANGGNVNVTGNINAPLGHVSIFTHGGGSLGGTLHVGSINARGAVSINANYLGAGSGFVAHAGNIAATNGFVGISMTGHNPKFSAGAITAHGLSSAKPSYAEAGVIPDGLVTVGLNKTGSAAGASGGSIKVNGNVLSSHSGVSFFVKNGVMKLSGPIAANKKVALSANSISDVGALSVSANNATGMASINVTGSVHGGTASFTANGGAGAAVKVGNVTTTIGKINISALTLSGIQAGNISAGNLNAAGYVALSQEGHSGGVHFTTIAAAGASPSVGHAGVRINTLVTGFSGNGGNVTGGAITATGGGIQIISSAGAASHHNNGGNITTGNLQGQYVSINTRAFGGANVSVGALTATGTGTAAKDVSLYAHANGPNPASHSHSYNPASGGNITVNGNITTGGRVRMDALGGHANGGNITVRGAITAGSLVSFLAANEGSAGGNISASAIAGKFVKLQTRPLWAGSSLHPANAAGGTITVGGNITAAGTATSISPSVGINLFAGSSGAKSGKPAITVHGNITASHAAANLIDYGSHNGRSITVGSAGSAYANGNITAHHMNLAINGAGSGGVINTGKLDATAGNIQVAQKLLTGTVAIHGGISDAGNVSVLQSNAGKMSIGGNVTVTGGNVLISGHGAVTLSGLMAVTGGGASIFGSSIGLGSVNNTGYLSVFAHALAPKAATITVTPGKVLQAQKVTLNASGSDGGKVTATTVTATGGSINMSAKQTSANSGSAVISAGNLTGRAVNLSAAGRNRKIATGAVTANGTTSTASVHDYVKLSLASSAAPLSGITVGGPIKSTHGSVSIAGRTGTITLVGAGSAGKNIKISATTINVGALTAGSAVSLTGIQSAAKPTIITATGLVKGQSVKATINLTNTATQSGSIHLASGASATGLGVGSIVITDSAAAPVKTKITTGALTTALRRISLFQKGGSGSVVVTGGMAAGGSSVDITASDTGLGGNINVAGNISGRDVRIFAHGNGGGDIAVTGSIHATACCSLSLNANAGPTLAGGNITVSGPITTTGGRIRIHTSGGGSAGGRISVGAMSARSSVSINANYHGTAAGFTAKTGAINTQGKVTVAMTGKAPHFSAAGITAKGSCECGSSGVKVQLHPSIASGSSGVINIAGPVLASEHGVKLSASHGSVIAGTVTANHLFNHPGNVSITGSVINVGGITDASGSVTLTGDKAARSTGITVSGPVTAQKVTVGINLPSTDAFGGAINLGAVSATGLLVSHDGINISAVTAAAKRMQITTGQLKAAGGDILLTEKGASGSVSVNGLISAAAGNVTVHQFGNGGMLLGPGGSALAIHAAHAVTLSASGSFGGITVRGNVTAGNIAIRTSDSSGGSIALNGMVTAASGNVLVSAVGFGAGIHAGGPISAANGAVTLTANGSGGITVNGNVTALQNASFHAVGSRAGGITVIGSIAGGGEGVTLTAQNTSGNNNINVTGGITVGVTESNAGAALNASAGTHAGGNVTVGGKITSNNGAVTVNAHGGGASGGRINVGSIAAHNNASITAVYTGNSPGFLVKTGPVNAEFVNVNLTGKAPHFSGAGLTAVGPASNGHISIGLHPTAPSSGSIHITGPVKSSHGSVTLNAAKGAVNLASGSTGKITAGKNISVIGGPIHLGSLSAGRALRVSASGSGHADSITVNGNITAPEVHLTAFGGNGDNVTVNGSITGLTAPSASFFSAGVSVTANAGSHSGGNIKITGNVSAASRSVFLDAIGGSKAAGNIDVGNITAASGASLSARYTGASAGFHVKTGTITAGYIQVNVDGLNPLFSAAGLSGQGHACECSANVSVRLADASFAAALGGSIKMAGPVTAAAGGITLNAGFGVVNMGGNSISAASNGTVRLKGGQLHLGSVSAAGHVSMDAYTVGGQSAAITATGLITAKYVNMNLHNSGGSRGGQIAVGAINATGTGVSFSSGKIHVNAVLPTKAVSITTGNLTAVRDVSVITNGGSAGGSSGGQLTVGNITAGGNVSISAVYTGAAAGFLTKTGTITAKTLRVDMTGKAPLFSAAALNATQSCECAGLSIQLHPSVASGSSGRIQVNGPVTAGHAGMSFKNSVSINASHGSVVVAGALTDFNGRVSIKGGNINVGGISALGNSVTLTGEKRSAAPTLITVTGPLDAGRVGAVINLPASDANSGSINLGSVSAAGAISIGAKTAAPHKTQITTGGLKTATGTIVVNQGGASGAVNISGSISAAGALSILAKDTAAPQASINVAGNIKAASVKLLASGSHGGKITATNITATGTVVGTGITSTGGSIVAKATELLPTVTPRRGVVNLGDLSATGRITVFGTTISVGGVNAGRDLFLSADGTSGRHATVTASKAIVFGNYGSIEAQGPSGAINVGNVTTTNGSVSFFASGAAGHPGTITVGNVTAKNYVAFFADSRTGTVNVGTIKASNSYVSMSAAKVTTTGPITAASYVSFYGGKFTVGGAVTAGAYVEMRGTQINVAGPITAGSQFGVTLPGHSRPVNAGFIELFANSAAGKASINVAGNVSGRTDSMSAKGLIGAAVNVGGVTATAGRVTILSGQVQTGSLSAAGPVHVTAGSGNIAVNGKIVSAANNPILNAAGSLTVAAAGSLAFIGGSVKAGKAVRLHAAGDLKLSNVTFTGSALSASAGGNLTDSTGGSLTLAGKTLTAGKNLHLIVGNDLLLANGNLTMASLNASVGGKVSNGGVAGILSDTGGISIKAKGSIVLTGETLHVGSGKATLSAAGGIAMTGADIAAGSLNAVTAGSIDLTGATANVSGTLQLVADKDIILSRVNINAGIFVAAASGSIHNGGGLGTITANAINVASKQSINLSSTDITLGSGALPSFAGDAQLIAELAGFNIAPTSSTLNGTFLADGSLTLGGLTITGHYLTLQGTSVAILGTVSAPTSGLLVQVIPFVPTATIGVEDTAATTQAFNLSNQGFLALFPGATIAIGDDVESGSVFIADNGAFTLAPKTNLFFDTTGTVTNLNLITTTGLVTSLEVFVAAVGTDVVTVGEIDPTADTTNTGLGDQTDKKKLGQTGNAGGNDQQGGGPISQDTTGAGVCH